jgi:CRP-like cAMP-binding protein
VIESSTKHPLLAAEDVNPTAPDADLRYLAPGDVLFFEGEQGDYAYVIKEGLVEISRRVGPAEVFLATGGPGEIVGEMALIDGKPRSATTRALRPTTVQVLPRDRFDALLNEADPAMRQLMERFVQIIRRLTDSTVRLTLGGP